MSPIVFEWTDDKGKKHVVGVKVTPQGIEFPSTDEKLPLWHFYAAQAITSARDNADRFAALRKTGKHLKFVRIFTDLFEWIEDVIVDSTAGTPVLSAVDRRSGTILPLTAISGGVNRMASILLAMAMRRKGIVMVDEVENGVFYARHPPFCQAILQFSREFDCQLFLSTHSQEWLRAFVHAAGEKVGDISLWRIERAKEGPRIRRFDGKTFRAGVEHGADVRRDKS